MCRCKLRLKVSEITNKMTTEHTIFAALDQVVEDAITLGHKPNALLLGKTEWGYFLTALTSIGMVLAPGRLPSHRGCRVFPVEIPDLIQVAYIWD